MTGTSPVDLNSTPKQMVLAILRNLPDGVTLDEIEHAVFVLQEALLARQAIANGDVYTQEQVEERMKQWLTPEN